MSPAADDTSDDIRRAIERLTAAGTPCSEANIAAELGVTEAQLHANMRQLFSDGRRIQPKQSDQPDPGET